LRLTQAHFVEESNHRFHLSGEVPADVRHAIAAHDTRGGRAAAAAFLNAEAWSEARNVGDPRDDVTYPGLSDDRIREAEADYRKRASPALRAATREPR
jgi:hypothetical protein